MSCCNHRRARLASVSPGLGPARTPPRAAAPARGARPAAGLPGTAETRLRFTGSRAVRVEGVVSGRIYHASPAAPLITASEADVRSLLRSGLFTRIPPGR